MIESLQKMIFLGNNKIVAKYKKIRFLFIIIALGLTPQMGSVFAQNIAVMPVAIYNDSTPITLLNNSFTPKKAAYELAKISLAYLKVMDVPGVVPFFETKKTLSKLKLFPNAKISIHKYHQYADALDSEKLLNIKVYYKQGVWNVNSKVFYAASGLNTDPIVTRGNNLLRTLGHHLQSRFRYAANRFARNTQPTSKKSKLLILDLAAISLDYNYWRRKYKPGLYEATAVCAGGITTQHLPFTSKSQKVQKFLRNLKPNALIKTNYKKLLNCARRNANRKKNIELIFYLGAAPKPKSSAALYAKGVLRQLTAKHKGKLIMGYANNDERSFWKNLADENKHLNYFDVLYRQKVAFPNGTLKYIFRSGNSIIESKDIRPQNNDRAISIPLNLRNRYAPQKTAQLYKQLSKQSLLDEYAAESLISNILQKNNETGNFQNNHRRKLRALVHTSAGPFWFTLPTKNAHKIKVGRHVWFLVQLTTPSHGFPLANAPKTVYFFNSLNDVPKSLVLPIRAYLKNPQKWLGHSIGGSSLYVIEGDLKSVIQK